jgi:uncharacterized membrane protein YkgB
MALRIVLSRYFLFWPGLLYLLLATPLARHSMETTMSVHMLVQMPLLVICGFMFCLLLPDAWQNKLLAALGGATSSVLLALFAASYWMLPRALDAALSNPLAEGAKFISLPILVGLPLALAWKKLSLIGRGFVWANLISMLAVLGWLYIVAPVRVCNNYLMNQQENTGWLMVKLALILFLYWLGTLFFGGKPVPLESSAAKSSVSDSLHN